MFRPTTDEEKARMVARLVRLSKAQLYGQLNTLGVVVTNDMTKVDLAWEIAKKSVAWEPDKVIGNGINLPKIKE